jgi:uncharacterized caspase-like protein
MSKKSPERTRLTFATFLIAAGIAIALVTCASSSGLAEEARQPQESVLWVFAVGVSDYRNSLIDLQYADNDAETLAATLKDRGAGIFRDVKTKVLVNEQVTRQSILDGMKSFFSQAHPNDTGVIALMGHSVISKGLFYFLPYPADLSNLRTEGLPVAEFEAAVQAASTKVKHLALMLDTCHAQALNVRVRDLNALQSNDRQARGISLVSEVANKVPDTFILGSSTLDESSWEDASYRMPGEKKGHGAFTYALLRGLDGEANTYRGPVEVGDLYAYASHTVRSITHDKQIPSHGGGGTSFPIARTPEPSKADSQQATTLLEEGERERQTVASLPQAKETLAKAARLNPNDEVAKELSDEASADIAYRNDPDARRDTVAAASALLKKSNYKGPNDPWTPRPMVIAFLDFSTAGGSPEHAGLHDALVARISQALQGTKRVKVVDRRLIEAVLQEQKLSMTDLSDPATRLKVGQILVSRLISTGDVASIDKDKYSVDLQMIDTETTEVKVNLSEPLDSSDNLFAVADKAANDILNQVEQDYPLKGKIVAVDGDRVVIDIGSDAGATTGSRMNAVVEEPIKVNGEVIATKLTRIGSLEITEVQPKASFAKVIDHTAELKPESKVIETAKPAASPSPAEATTRTVAPS